MTKKKSFIRLEVLQVHGYSLKKQNDRIKLNQNESPYDLPEVLKAKVLEKMNQAAWNRYPIPYATGLAAKIAAREGLGPENVLVSGGSNVLIQALVSATAIHQRVMTIAPSFSLYELQGKLFGNKVTEIILNDDFSLPTEKILKALKKESPQIVFLPNPNAPTGNLFPEKDLLMLIKKAPGLVVVDEAYYPFSGMTLAHHLKKLKNLVVLRTFSKAFSLGGARLGYMMASKSVVSEVQKILLPFSVGIFSQILGEVVLEESSYMQKVVEEIIAEREQIYQELCKVPGLKVYPSKANFVLFQPATMGLFKNIQEKLSQQGIVIRDVSCPCLPRALRISVGTPAENQEFLKALRSY